MMNDFKGTTCELPFDATTPGTPEEGDSLSNIMDLLENQQKTDSSWDEGSLFNLQAQESKDLKDLPLAVASLTTNSPEDDGAILVVQKPHYTDKKEKKRSWPCWAIVLCVLVAILLAIAISSLVLLTNMRGSQNQVEGSSQSLSQQLTPILTPEATEIPTKAPAPAPTTSPTTKPAKEATTRPTYAPLARIDDDAEVSEENCEGFWNGLICLAIWFFG